MILVRTHDGGEHRLPVNPDQTLAQAVFLAGLWQDVPLCAGLGRCGLCRVRFLSDPPSFGRDEKRKFSTDQLYDGWRLACLHPAEACEIEIPKPVRSRRSRKTVKADTGPFSLAVDLGTTSIHWQALHDNTVLASGKALNPQAGLGSEIMSRLSYAAKPGGADTLRTLATKHISQLAQSLESELGGKCETLSVAGNSVMTYLLLGMNTDTLAAAPYSLQYKGGDEQPVAPGLPDAYIPPLLAPFVGADLSAGLAALEFGKDAPYPFVLADMGTNGEFVLALSPDERLCTSVPMGPALEGVGLAFGRTAGPGAVYGFTVTPAGLEAKRIEGPIPERPGMTGTAYLSLAAILLSAGLLTEQGQFGKATTPLTEKLADNIDTTGAEPLYRLPDNMHMAASDLEEILKVKAAFNLALSTLLDRADLRPSDLKALHIAGAMGEHVGLSDLEKLGFLPSGVSSVTRRAGNTSLAGARLLLHSPTAREWVKHISKTCTVINLAGDSEFGTQFLNRMCFRYVH